MQQISVPGEGILQFPDGMSDDAIREAIHRNFPNLPSPPQLSPPYRQDIQAQQQEIMDRMQGDFGDLSGLTGAAPPGYETGKTYGQLAKENAPLLGATAASLVAPELALPAWAAKLAAGGRFAKIAGALIKPAIVNAPKIAAAFGGGAGGGAFREAGRIPEPGQPEPTLASTAMAGLESGVEMATAETLGGYVAAVLRPLLSTKGVAGAEKQDAIDFARSRGAPLPVADLTGGYGVTVLDKTVAGRLAQQGAAKKANEIINVELANLAKGATTVDDAAQKGNALLKNILAEQKEAGKAAFDTFEETVGKDTILALNETAAALQKAKIVLERVGFKEKKARQGMRTLKPMIDAMVESGTQQGSLAELEALRKAAGKAGFSNFAIKDAMENLRNAIVKDYDVAGKNVGLDFPALLKNATDEYAKFYKLRNIPGMQRFSADIGTKGAPAGTRNWMAELFTNNNKAALEELRKHAPEQFTELAATNMATVIQKHTRPLGEGLETIFDGPGFRKYVEQNATNLKSIYGPNIFQTLDNFSLYAKHSSPLMQRAATGKLDILNVKDLFSGRSIMTGGEAATMANYPILIPVEGGAYVLAKSLMNPNNKLYGAFAKGFDITPRETLKLGGRAVFQDFGQTQE